NRDAVGGCSQGVPGAMAGHRGARSALRGGSARLRPDRRDRDLSRRQCRFPALPRSAPSLPRARVVSRPHRQAGSVDHRASVDRHPSVKVQLQQRHGLLLTPVEVTYGASTRIIPDVLLDTGSAGTILAVDAVAELGISFAPDDLISGIRGVGGREFVFHRRLDRLAIEGYGIEGCDVEIGGMDYGFPLNGILGLDFLTR